MKIVAPTVAPIDFCSQFIKFGIRHKPLFLLVSPDGIEPSTY